MNVSDIAERAKRAARELAAASGMARAAALNHMAAELAAVKTELFAANAADVAEAEKTGISDAFLHRLMVTEKIFAYMMNRLEECAALPDPVGRVLEGRTMPSGLKVTKIAVPIGVVAIIYEARPNVTTDAAAVALKSGNAVILKGGSESLRTNRVLIGAMQRAMEKAGLSPEAVQFLDTKEHDAVSELLKLDDLIDLVIPRGGKSLIRAVSGHTTIPVLKHYDGICHQYVAASADIDKAVAVVLNSKTQRVEVCNALETLLVDAAAAPAFLPLMAEKFREKKVEMRGCEATRKWIPDALAAVPEDWDTEYLGPVISIRIVSGVEEAAAHITAHGSGHTDGILTRDLNEARRFVQLVDSASVMINASTRLSGGGDYGMGAVVGISTGKIHARGPVGAAELCSCKWIAEGDGTLRG